jgi:hypothetical protein
MVEAQWNRIAKKDFVYKEICLLITSPSHGVVLEDMAISEGLEIYKQAC